MRHRSVGEQIRESRLGNHSAKEGTPTMGGLIILLAWIAGILSLSAAVPWTRLTGLVLTAGLMYGAIGAADDLISLRRRQSAGLSAGGKLALSTLASVVLFFVFRDTILVPILVPFTQTSISLPPAAAFFLTWFVFLATTNGVNLTDGLDGLAGGVSLLILVGVLLLAPDRGTVAVTLPLAGTLLGFLWINGHPAGLFLGDVGSYALGGVIAALSLARGLAFLLPILAGVLVLEVGSVILQVASFRWTGLRIFRMSPLHHHFEAGSAPSSRYILRAPNWPEEKIAIRFWIVQALFVAIAVLAGHSAA